MPEMNAHAPITPQPPRRTRIRRDFVKLLLLLLGSTLFAIVIVRYLSHSHLTAAERREEEALKAAAREPSARPEALAKRLADEHSLAQVRQRAALAPAGGTPLDDPGIPEGQPGRRGDGPLPPGFSVPGADHDRLSGQDRLALQRQAEQLDNQSLVAWEDRNSTQGTAPGTVSPVTVQRSTGAPANFVDQSEPSGQDAREGRVAGPVVSPDNSGLSTPETGRALTGNLPAHARNAQWLAGESGDAQDQPLSPVAVASPYMVVEGTPINTVMLGGTKSDLPGTFRALVDHDIVDTIHGECVLIPKGTKIIGRTHDDVAIGQERLLLAGTRMIWPNGASMSLTRMPGADPDGDAGLTADVNNHFFRIFGSTLLIAGVAAWIGHNQPQSTGTTINVNGGGANDLSAAAAQSLSQTTQTILQRNMNIQPTLTTAPGQRMVIVTARDMMIPPELVASTCSQ